MAQADRTIWFKAAYLALDGYPADLIQHGAKAAMATADHPSKIVPAITKAVGEIWRERRALLERMTRSREELAAQAAQNQALRLTAQDEDGHETTASILARVWPTMNQHDPEYRPGGLNLDPDRPCRVPTRTDYLALGVAPEALDALDIRPA